MEENKHIEDLFRSSLQDVEYPYDPKAWKSLENKLPKKTNTSFLKWGLGGAAIVITICMLTFLNRGEDTKQNKSTTAIELKTNSSKPVNKKKTKKLDEVNNTNVETIKFVGDKNKNASAQIIEPSKMDPTIIPNNNSNLVESLPTKSSKQDAENTSINPIPANEEVYLPSLPNFSPKCQGEKFEYSNKNQNPVQLIFPSGKIVSAKEGERISCNLQESGSYKVCSIDKNQSTSILEEVSFAVNKGPSAELQLSDALDYESGLPVLHCECITSETSIKWVLNGKICDGNSDLKNDLVLYNKGLNRIEANVKNEIGCEAKVTRIFNVEDDYNLLSVNSFSPNASDLRRISFMPYALTIRNSKFVLTIMDPENGGILFTSDDISLPWDGIDRRTGNLIPDDKAYIWRVVLSNPEPGEKSVYKGTIRRF